MRQFISASLIVASMLVLLSSGAEGLRPLSGSSPHGAATSVVTENTGGPQGPLKKVVFAHRHCARTEVSDIGNGCGRVGCGMCTTQGELMLKATGESFRERYGSVLSTEYHMDKYKSYSDGAPRTQQSASAFINGLFAFNTSYLVAPAIDTDSNVGIDPWSSLPTYKLRDDLNDAGSVLSALPNISHYVSEKTLKAIAKEIGLISIACDLAHGIACAAAEIDFLYSARAEGTLYKYPVAVAHWSELSAAQQFFEPFMSFGWQHFVNKDGFFEKAGYPGHPIFDNMLAAAGSNDANVLTEFSGHDTTLMPLYAAMGNYTVVYPHFATSVVFEVYTNPTETSNPFIVVKTALPDQLPGTHPLTWFEYDLTCMNATSGQTYTTTTGCPLRDLAAFAATRRGTETGAMGGCYAFPADLTDTLCNNKSGDKPFGPCLKYRQSCPLVACGVGYYMKPDYSCNPV